jgi:hypothetical protein
MYNKIFTKILDSSIWLESDSTRIVWVTMIAAMDENGFCQFASVANVARRANVSPQAASEAIEILQNPDSDSSDPENEGRRIERVPGGWIVLNAEKYRALVTRAVSQEGNRRRVQQFRAIYMSCRIITMKRKRLGASSVKAVTNALGWWRTERRFLFESRISTSPI